MAAMSAGHRIDLSGRSTDAVAAFTEFAREAERRLRPALVFFFGAERGREATQDALVYAWTLELTIIHEPSVTPAPRVWSRPIQWRCHREDGR